MILTKWLTVDETAKMTGQSRWTVYNYIKKGHYEAKQVKKGCQWFIDIFSIPTFLRTRKEKNGKTSTRAF